MRIFIIALIFTYINSSFGQSSAAYEKAGDKASKQGNYYEAMMLYMKAIEFNSTGELTEKVGMMAFKSHSFEIAKKYFTEIIQQKKWRKKYPEATYYLAETEKYLGNYNYALDLFNTYKNENQNGEFNNKAIVNIKDLSNINKLPNDTTVELKRLDKVNTEFSDFAAIQVGDSLIFSSLRFQFSIDKKSPKRIFSKILLAKPNEKGKVINNLDPKDTIHFAHYTTNLERNKIIFTKCIYLDDNEIQCNLYESKLEKNGKWSKPTKLDFPINERGFTTTHPQIVFDSSEQKEYLFFVSNRTGGKGKLDIWKAKLLDKYYEAPKNLTEINTIENDITPFFDLKSKSLYFSSLGHGGFGGYDIFRYNSDKKIENIGKPYNSSLDDVYYSISPKNEYIYLSSNRPGSLYLDKNNQTCCYDIYQSKISNPKEIVNQDITKKDSLISKTIITTQNEQFIKKDSIIIATVESPKTKKTTTENKLTQATPIQQEEKQKVVIEKTKVQPKIVVENKVSKEVKIAEPIKNQSIEKSELNTLLPISLYFDNDEPDKRTLETTTIKNYEETYFYYRQKKDFFKTEFQAPNNIQVTDNQLLLIDNFFDNDVDPGMQKLNQFAEALYEKLSTNRTVEVYIKGFTSPRATSEYNQSLAQRRIHCVKNYFKVWHFGALQKYIKSGNLKILEKPLGETTSPSDVSDDLENMPASVYDVKASKERRVEIVETKEF